MRFYSTITGKTYSSEARMRYAERLHNEYVSNEAGFWAKRGYIEVDGQYQKTKEIIKDDIFNYDNAPNGVKDDANEYHSASWIGANSLYDPASGIRLSQVLSSAVDGDAGNYPTTDDVLDVWYGKQKADFIRDYYDRHWGEF